MSDNQEIYSARKRVHDMSAVVQTTGLWILTIVLALAVPASAQQATVSATLNGSTVQITASNGPGSIYDWFSIVPVGSAANFYTGIWFMNGTSVPTASPMTSARFSIPAPTANGRYEVRWLASGYYGRIATSDVIWVGPPPPPPTAQGAVVFNGDSNTAYYYEPAPTNWTTLSASGLGFASVVNMAATGKYAAGVLADVPSMVLQHPAACMVMIGTNDVAHAVETDAVMDQARADFLQTMRDIIGGLKAGCGRVVIMAPIFTMNAREVAILDDWVSGLHRLCAELGVAFADVYAYMRSLSSVQSTVIFDSYFRVPGVDFHHLSAAGHAMLAGFVLRQGRWTP